MKRVLVFVLFLVGIGLMVPSVILSQQTAPQIDIEKQTEADGFSTLGRKAVDVFEPGRGEPAPSTPGDAALGEQYILKRKYEYQPLTLFGNAALNWTSNVALTKNNPQDDNFILSTVGGSYQPIIRPNLLGEITAMYQWFRYDRFTDMDFESFNIGAGLSYVMPELKNLAVFCRYNYNRLTNADAQSEYFRNNTVTVGFYKAFPLARAHYLYLGYSSQFGFADPKVYQRDYHSAVGGYSLDITKKLNVELGVRLSYVPYQENNRRDYNESVTLGITYKPCPWLSFNLVSLTAFNQSNQSVFEYDVVNIAPNIGVKIKF